MFYNDNHLIRSTVLDLSGVAHAFSTRLGGVSTLPHTAQMNIAEGHGDDVETVRRNFDLLISSATGRLCGGGDGVCAHQIHSAKLRLLTEENCGEGITCPSGEDCDGFVTDRPGVVPVVRTADCVPVLMCGTKPDSSPVVCAIHAGWRGTAAGIVAVGIRQMESLGALRGTIRAAVGPHIGFCCFEVGGDMRDSVAALRGEDFATRHIRMEAGRLRADLSGMNLELLLEAGLSRENIDLSRECTCCNNTKFHSHRATKGLRGAMGSCICILK